MSKNVLRVGVDAAGGTITGVISTKTFVTGSLIVCVGAAVASHGSAPHNAATMNAGSSKTTANGIPICGVGDPATCGDVGAGGSPKTFYG